MHFTGTKFLPYIMLLLNHNTCLALIKDTFLQAQKCLFTNQFIQFTGHIEQTHIQTGSEFVFKKGIEELYPASNMYLKGRPSRVICNANRKTSAQLENQI